MSSIKYVQQIINSRKKFFTSGELRQLLEVESARTLENIIHKLIQEKVLVSLEKGKYLVLNQQASDFEIAQFLYQPSYVSFESALNYHGALSQFPMEITSVTTKKRVSKQFDDKIFSYAKIKISLFTGYYKVDDFLMAFPEKALFDQMYMIVKSLKTKEYLDEMDYSRVDVKKVRKYFDLTSKHFATGINKLLEEYL
ncbi:MAG: hypothetical protein ABIJ43_02735 [Candidatus Beckwithbacteria bacterium]